MVETLFFIAGVGFSILVWVMTIRTGNHSLPHKTLFTLLSTIGITGTIWLFGVLIAHFLKKLHLLL